jgi:hypothetical protein
MVTAGRSILRGAGSGALPAVFGMNAGYSFASNHSKTEVNGNTLEYMRTFEVQELSVPLSKVEDLKTLYRVIASDERSTAVLKPVAP